MRLKNELSHHWAYIFIALGTIISTGPKELQAPNPDPAPAKYWMKFLALISPYPQVQRHTLKFKEKQEDGPVPTQKAQHALWQPNEVWESQLGPESNKQNLQKMLWNKWEILKVAWELDDISQSILRWRTSFFVFVSLCLRLMLL